MGVTEVCGHLQPLLCLIIGIDAACVSLEVRVVYYTSIVKIADASVVTEFIFGTADREVVFLPE